MANTAPPPIVSVIVPAYNVALYIAEALASVQAQTLGQFEAIVIEDGSTDDTPARIAPFLADPRFRLIRTANRGLSAARNRGIAEARAPLVALLDGDDRYRPDYLVRMTARLDETPAASFVTCDAVSFAAGDARRERFSARYAQGEPITLAALLRAEVAIFGLCTVRTAALRSVGGYDEALRAAEDLDLWLRLMGDGHVGGLVPEILVEYRRRPGSLSDDSAKLTRARARAFDKAATALANRPEAVLAARARDAALAVCEFEAGVDLVLAGDVARGVRAMRASGLKDGSRKWAAAMKAFSLAPPLAQPALAHYRRGNQFT